MTFYKEIICYRTKVHKYTCWIHFWLEILLISWRKTEKSTFEADISAYQDCHPDMPSGWQSWCTLISALKLDFSVFLYEIMGISCKNIPLFVRILQLNVWYYQITSKRPYLNHYFYRGVCLSMRRASVSPLVRPSQNFFFA